MTTRNRPVKIGDLDCFKRLCEALGYRPFTCDISVTDRESDHMAREERDNQLRARNYSPSRKKWGKR